MTIKKRILQYLKYKGLKRDYFTEKTGLSKGYLDSKGDIGSSNLEIIKKQFPEIELSWLVLGEGEMLQRETDISKGLLKRTGLAIEFLYTLGITQEEIARKAQVDELTIRELVMEGTYISLDLIYKIAKPFEISLNFLFYYSYPIIEEPIKECELCKAKDETIQSLKQINALLLDRR